MLAGRSISRARSTASPIACPAPVSPAVAQKTTYDSFQFDAQFGAGQDVFDALTRRIDRIDASYKS